MTRDEIRDRIQVLLGEILDRDELSLTDDTKADDIEDWDSINHVKLIIAIESEFNIRFEADEVTAPENVGALVDLVQSKLAEA